MRVLVISDIHANLAAFEAVLETAQGKWDIIWFLGDLVGYGPDPNECVSLLREHDHLALSGNHDWAVLDRLDLSTFNQDAEWAIRWTQDKLNDDNRHYLEELNPSQVEEPFTLAHGSPRHPVWEYILDQRVAAVNFDHFETPFCLVGHTHTPIIYERQTKTRVVAYIPAYDTQILLNEYRLIINPGSVGQPRDLDPRAAYAILDLEENCWQHCRVEYDVSATQEKMRRAGHSDRLITRLAHGW